MEKQKKQVMLNVPFYANTGDGSQCYQVAMQSALKYFLSEDFSVETLDKLTNRKKDKWTATTQIVPALYELGLKVRYYSKTELEAALSGEKYIRETYGADADKVLKIVDVDALVESARTLLKYDLFEQKVLSLEEIEEHVRKKHVPLVLIDWNKIIGRPSYQGHFGVITGFDEENIYFHQSGPATPTPNMKITKSTFMEAWNVKGTDNDIVMVYGKR